MRCDDVELLSFLREPSRSTSRRRAGFISSLICLRGLRQSAAAEAVEEAQRRAAERAAAHGRSPRWSASATLTTSTQTSSRPSGREQQLNQPDIDPDSNFFCARGPSLLRHPMPVPAAREASQSDVSLSDFFENATVARAGGAGQDVGWPLLAWPRRGDSKVQSACREAAVCRCRAVATALPCPLSPTRTASGSWSRMTAGEPVYNEVEAVAVKGRAERRRAGEGAQRDCRAARHPAHDRCSTIDDDRSRSSTTTGRCRSS